MNGFVQWMLSPLAAWHVLSIYHKLAAASVGAGAAYFLKDKPAWQIILGSMGAAYGTTLVLNASRSYALAGLGTGTSGTTQVPVPVQTTVIPPFQPQAPVFASEAAYPAPPAPMPEVPIQSGESVSESPADDEGIFG